MPLPNRRRGQLPPVVWPAPQPPTHRACHPARFLFCDLPASCFLVSIRRLWYNVNISYSHRRNISLCVASIYSFDYEKSMNPLIDLWQVCLSMFQLHYQLLNVSAKLVRRRCPESSLQFKCSSKSSKKFKYSLKFKCSSTSYRWCFSIQNLLKSAGGVWSSYRSNSQISGGLVYECGKSVNPASDFWMRAGRKAVFCIH